MRFGGPVVLALCVLAMVSGAATVAMRRNQVVSGRAAGEAGPVRSELEGVHELAVFFASQACASCRTRGLQAGVARLIDSLRIASGSRGHHFRAVGVTIDAPTANAIEWLNGFGPFDEISAGGNWLNGSIIRFAWRGKLQTVGVPQLLLVSYSAAVDRRLDGTGAELLVSSDSILATWLGAGQLLPTPSVQRPN